VRHNHGQSKYQFPSTLPAAYGAASGRELNLNSIISTPAQPERAAVSLRERGKTMTH